MSKFTLAELVDQFSKDLIGWKQHKKSFAIYFKRNKAKPFCNMITTAWKEIGEAKK